MFNKMKIPTAYVPAFLAVLGAGYVALPGCAPVPQILRPHWHSAIVLVQLAHIQCSALMGGEHWQAHALHRSHSAYAPVQLNRSLTRRTDGCWTLAGSWPSPTLSP